MAFVGKPLKIILVLMIGLLLLGLSASAFLTLFIDPNDYKPQIIALVKEKTGRELQLPGDIDLSIFPWLGVSTGQIILNNTRDFSEHPFATIERSDIRVKLMPLLSRQIQVSQIVLKGLHVNLIKNKQGVVNWADLMPLAKAETENPAANHQQTSERVSETETKFAIDEINVQQASLDWDNQQNGKRIEARDLNLKAENVAFDQPAAIGMSFRIAKAGVQPLNSFKITSNLKVTQHFDFFNLSDFELNYIREDTAIQAHPLTAILKAADIAYDKAGQSMKMAGVKLDSGELHIDAELSGNTMADKPSVQGSVAVARFNLSKYLQRLHFSLPSMQDANALNNVELQGNVLASAETVAIEKLAGQVDDTHVKGSATLRDFARPEVGFDLQLDALDADRYLPPKLKTKKPITTPAVALAAGLSKLPIDTLKKLNINGNLSLNKLKINDLTMQDIRLSINGKQGNITAKQAIQQFYQGSYSGDLSLSLRNEQSLLSINENIDRVQVEPLLKDFKGKAQITGVVNASSQLQGQGRNAKELKSGLGGQFNFQFKEAAIKGFNLQKIIDSVKASQKGTSVVTPNENDQTVFAEITGTAKLSEGLVQNNDLVANSSRFRIDGQGSVNLNTDSLDYKIITRLKKTPANPSETEQFHSTPVVLNIGGTFNKPVYTLDISALLTEKNKEKIEKFLDKKKEKVDKLLDKLDKKLGPGTSDLLKSIF
ncbi:MAG: AsmA family protein [Methylosarcina sp.]